MRFNRKGDLLSIILVFVILFVVAIVGLILVYMSNAAQTQIQNNDLIQSNANAAKSTQLSKDLVPQMNNTFVALLVIALVAGLIFTVMYSNFSTPFLVIFIIVFLVLVVIAAMMGSVYSSAANSDSFKGTTTQLPVAGWLFSPWSGAIMLCIGVLIIIIMYGKNRGGGSMPV